ncbi:MAG: hypothetical protein D3923_03245 [Candidatus Electrothrix sp. AR3]|nr:hypothetical protein [Candidatus Electrothrix sp. AR3]
MDDIKPIDALHVAGSVASITGISLLAIGSVTNEIQFATILAYSMSASIFLGILGLLIFGFRWLYPKLEVKAGKGIAVSISAVMIPLLVWINFYLILILKSLASNEFLWLLKQISE